MSDKVRKTEAEWRAQLSPVQYAVTREKATERPWTGEYNSTKTPGVYKCICCGEELFESDAKFDSHCGWPSFTAPLKEGAVDEEDGEDGDVKVGHKVGKAAGQRPAERGGNLRHVVEVARHGPPAVGEEDGRLDLALRGAGGGRGEPSGDFARSRALSLSPAARAAAKLNKRTPSVRYSAGSVRAAWPQMVHCPLVSRARARWRSAS